MASVNTPTAAGSDPQVVAKPKLSARDWRVLDSTFSIDTRALAVVRILLGGFILFHALVFELDTPRNPTTPIGWLEDYGIILAIPFAVMLLVGYKTRWAVALTWLTYSLPIRATMVEMGEVELGYYILNIVLFWGMFLPWGRHLSVDARGKEETPLRFLSGGSAALLFQIFIIYFSAGLIKDHGDWLFEASAMETLLSLPIYETPLGQWMLNFPKVLAVMSIATVVLELVGPLLIIIPGKTLAKRRMIMVPVFMAFHIGIAALMGLGMFPYIMIGVWLIYLPPVFWDKVWARFKWGTTSTEIYIDRSRWRNWTALVFVAISALSFVMVWMYWPDYEGFSDFYQWFTIYLLLYQRWMMFNVPSRI